MRYDINRIVHKYHFQILLPAIFVLFALLVTLLVPYPEPSKPLEMHPWLYPPRPKNEERKLMLKLCTFFLELLK